MNEPEGTGPGAARGPYFGSRRGDRCGAAVSDELGLTAQPCVTLVRKNRRRGHGTRSALCACTGCIRAVVGNPLYMSGDISPQYLLKAQSFAQAVQLESGVGVTLWDATAHHHGSAPSPGCSWPYAREPPRGD